MLPTTGIHVMKCLFIEYKSLLFIVGAAFLEIFEMNCTGTGCPIFSRNTLFKTLNLLDFDGFEGRSVKIAFRAQIL